VGLFARHWYCTECVHLGYPDEQAHDPPLRANANYAAHTPVPAELQVLTQQLHACVVDLWRRRGSVAPVDPEMLRKPDAWWNVMLKTAIKAAPVEVLDRSQALHLAISLRLKWAVDTLLERKVPHRPFPPLARPKS
jgi:hypothetical protein